MKYFNVKHKTMNGRVNSAIIPMVNDNKTLFSKSITCATIYLKVINSSLNYWKNLSALIFLIIVGTENLQAGTKTWNGTTNSQNWSNSANWSPTGIPGSGDDVIINNGNIAIVDISTAICKSVQIGVSKTNIGSLTFSSSIPANQLTVIGNFTVGDNNNGANAKTGSLDMTNGGILIVGGSLTAPNLAVNGWLPGNGTIVYNGTAQTVYANSTAYNNLTLAGSLAKTITGTTVNGILSMEGTATTTGTPTYGPASTLQYNGTSTQTTGSEFPATFSGSGGVIINNTNGVKLGAPKIIAHMLTMTSGTLDMADVALTTGSLTGSGNLTNLSGTAAQLVTIGNDNTSPAAYSGVISTGSATSVALTKLGTGTLTLSGANTYSGATTVNGGTLKAGITTQAFGLNSAVTLANTIGATLDITGFANTIGSLTGGGTIGGNVTLGATTLTIGTDNTSPAAYAGIISGTGAISKSGTGTLILSGTNTYTGTTTVSAGTLKLGSASALGATSSGTTVANGAVLDLNGINYSNAEPLTISGTGITNGGAIINSSLNGATFAGLITLGSTSSIIGGTGAINISNTGTITGAAFNLTLGGAQGGTLASSLGTTSGTLTKQDAGTWTLSGANTYTGTTTVSAGTLKLGSASALGATSSGTTVANGAVLDLNGINYSNAEPLTISGTGITNGGAIINSSLNGATFAGLITLGSTSSIIGGTGAINISNTGTITGAAFNLTLGGAQGGTLASSLGTTSGTLTKQDAGTWTLSGTNTFTGGLILNSGTIQLGSGNCLTSSLPITLNGGTLGTGASTGFVNTANTLSLTYNSTIALGTGVHSLKFADSNLIGWTAGKSLTITGWTGSYHGTSGTAGQLFVGSSSGLTPTQLSQIQFKDGSNNLFPAILLSTGEVVPSQTFAADYFRSILTGNWSTASNWQSSADNIYWITASLAPTSSATSITIQSPNTITVDVNNQTASSMVIASGGTLAGGSNNLTVTGNWTNSGGTFTPGSGTVTFTGNATAINGTALTQVFNNIVVNKTSGQTLTVGGSTTTLTVGGTFTETQGNFTAPAILNVTGDLTLTSGTFTTGTSMTESGNWINNGGTFIPGTGTITFTGNSSAIKGTALTQAFNNTVVNKISGQTLSVGGSTTTLSVGGTFIETLGNFTAPAILNVTGDMTLTSGTFTAGTTLTESGNWINNGGTFVHNGGTVTFNGAAARTINSGGSPFNNFILTNTGGTSTALSNGITTAGTFTTSANTTLDMGTNVLSTINVAHAGTLLTQNLSTSPITAGKLWGGTVNYNAATGGQTVMAGTYAILNLGNTSGTQTVTGNITATTLNNTNTTSSLDMSTYTLGVTNVNNSGTIKTQSIFASSLCSCLNWGGTVDYNAATGGQTLMEGTYNNLTLGNSSGTQSASTDLTVNGTLTTTSGGTLDMRTFQLVETTGTVINNGTIATQNTSSTPIPLDKSWDGEIVYNGTSPQTAVTGTYTNLTIDNAPGVFLSDTTKTGNVTGKLWIKNGKRLEIGTKAEMIAAAIQNDAGSSGILIKAGSSLANGTLIFSGIAPQATVEMYSKASWNKDDLNPDNRYHWQFFGIPVKSVVANPTFNGSYVRKWDESGTASSNNYWLQLGSGSTLTSFLGYELCQESPTTLVFKGLLENGNFDSGPLAYTDGAKYQGQHIFANPYTAAIDVRKLDFGTETEATVYLYNAGSFSQWTTGGQVSPENDPGQYTAIPKIPAGDLGIPYEVPSMQAMLVKAMSNSSNATFGINYSSVITKNTVQQRVKASNEPASTDKVCTVIDVIGTHYSDRMWIFTNPACSHRFNNGWDGAKLLGSALSPQLFALETDGNYQVDAVDDMNNTRLGFLPGTDVSYTFTFTHSNTESKYAGIYLRDNAENKTIDITQSGSVYPFLAGSDPQASNRFMIITRPYEKDAPDKDSELKIFTGINTILIQNVSSQDGEVMIYDIAGHYLKKVSLSPSSITTVTGVMPGAYVAKAFTSKDGVTKRLIVQ